jgi:cyclopropane fatty-acyl-phospholipid synthase-like methyltransferase
MDIQNNKNLTQEELEKLGYWKNMYSKPNVFGEGPTKLALIANDFIKKQNVKKILELGCGQGRDSIYFAQNNFHVTATDFSDNAINFVRKTAQELRLNTLKTKTQNMLHDFDDFFEFDCVYSNLALQFFTEDQLESIFHKISLTLKESGLFIFSTKKPGDKYHNTGEKINEYAFKTNNITRYFFDKSVLSNLLNSKYDIHKVEEMKHVNPNGTVSAWWYFIAQRL